MALPHGRGPAVDRGDVRRAARSGDGPSPDRAPAPRPGGRSTSSARSSTSAATSGPSAEAIFGGPRRIEAFTELTAVAVELDEGRSLPPAEQLAGWFEAGGALLEVAAVEDGPVEVVLVFEGSALERFRRMYRAPVVATPSGLPEDFTFRLVFPVGRMTAQSTMVSNVYPISRRLGRTDGALSWVAGRLVDGPACTRKGQRLADAVAVAALAAAGEERRRAVVLVLGPEAEDGSLLTAGEAASFLERLRVPLHVWSIGTKLSPEAARWGGGRKIASTRELDTAMTELARLLERQRIVWVEGIQPAPGRDPDRLGGRGAGWRAEGYLTSQKQWA